MQGSQINATTQGAGADIRIEIDNDFSLDSSLVNSNTESFEAGGKITIKAGNLSLTNGAAIQTETYADGQGGSISIEVQDTLSIDGTESLSLEGGTQKPVTGLLSNAKEQSGNGGNILVTAGSILLDNEATIHALTFDAGKGGNITLNSTNLTIKNHATINTSSDKENTGGGDAGSININTSGFIKIEDQLGSDNIDSQQAAGILSDTLNGTGGGGQIIITTAQLIMDGNTEIAAKTLGQAQSGDITIQADDISLLNGASISNNNEFSSTGSGGKLSINANNILISGANTEKASGLFSETQGTGTGGNITLNTTTLSLNNEGGISAKSGSTGDAGSININSSGDIIFDNGNIRTSADNAAGGVITLNGRHIHLFNNSTIDASVNSGGGGGGNIAITARTLIALGNSDFIAFAQQGWGGNIVLNAEAVFFSQDSNLNASSDVEGQDGTEQINSPEVDISATLLSLPENFIDAKSILPESCAVQGRENKSSFIIDQLPGAASAYGRLLLSP